MCGIVATMRLDGRPIERHDLERMRDTMYHRRPRRRGLLRRRQCWPGLRRLAIIDLSEAGHQPMSNEDGNDLAGL
jgi:asparagine synthase (glutamine-hydrolysing)